MRHPHIVSLIASSLDGPYRCVVLEYMAEGTLDLRLANLELPVLQWQDRARILLHVVRGLVYLHSLSPAVVHRDVQCRNVLLHHAEPDQSMLTAKLSIDFGESSGRSKARTSSPPTFRFIVLSMLPHSFYATRHRK